MYTRIGTKIDASSVDLLLKAFPLVRLVVESCRDLPRAYRTSLSYPNRNTQPQSTKLNTANAAYTNAVEKDEKDANLRRTSRTSRTRYSHTSGLTSDGDGDAGDGTCGDGVGISDNDDDDDDDDDDYDVNDLNYGENDNV